MAIDPSFGLGAPSAPTPSTIPTAPNGGLTPEQVQAMRAQAIAMQKMPEVGIKHWTQGLAYLLNAIQGNREADFARQQEMAGRKSAADAISQIYAPYLSSGGGSSSATTGAPAGGSAPAVGATSSSDPHSYISRLFQIESGGDPNAQTGSNRGLAQFSPDLEAKYGITDKNRTDPNAQIAAVSQERSENLPILRSTLGRDPRPGEEYLMHQQGVAGGPALMSADPNMPAWRAIRPFYSSDAIAQKAITGNLGSDSGLGTDPNKITVGQFRNYWVNKFESGMPQQTAASPTPPNAPPQAMAFAGPQGGGGAPNLPPAITQGQTPAAIPANAGAMVNAIAGRPMPVAAPPQASPGPQAPLPQVAGPPSAAAPIPAASAPAAGPPPPLLSPTGQITRDQLTQVLANPWVPDSAKAGMLQMIQQRGQVQTREVPGGTQYFTANGQTQFVPKTIMDHIEIPGGGKVPVLLVGHPDGSFTQQPLTREGAKAGGEEGEPDLTTVKGMSEFANKQAGAKKEAEEFGTTQAKQYTAIHTGLQGDALNAARQASIVDELQKIAPAALSGTGSEAQLALARIASQVGIAPGRAQPAELFEMLSKKILADQFSGIRNMAQEEGSPGGRVFKSMLDVEERANINRADSLEGIQAKLALIKQMGDQVQRWGDMADDYATKNGHLDAGFMKVLRKDIAGTKFTEVPASAPAASGPSQDDIAAEMRKRGLLK